MIALRRNMIMQSGEAEPENMVIGFEPTTISLDYFTNKQYATTAAFEYNKAYTFEIDATLASDLRLWVFLGTIDRQGTALTYGQNGTETRTVTINNSGRAARVYIYVRPSSNDGKKHSATLNSLRVYES